MALKPDEGQTFLKEVDEELRKEQMSNFVSRYGWAILGAVVLVIASVGGWLWWQNSQQEQAAQQGEALIDALDSMEAGNRVAAKGKVDQLADSEIEGYRAAALFTRANNQIAGGNVPAAIQTLKGIAEDEGLDQSYREAALVRRTLLEFDTLRPQEVVQRLRPLAGEGSAWLGSAGEMVGIAYVRMNRGDLAGPIFQRIARDENVPASIRSRAVQMAGSLGFDALDEGSGGSGPRAAPAATREKAQ